MEPKLSDRQGQNCHVLLSGHEVGLVKLFTSELTEGKAASQARRARRSYDCRERHKNICKCGKL